MALNCLNGEKTMIKDKNCKDLVNENWAERKADLDGLIAHAEKGFNSDFDNDTANIHEYHLSIDVVPAEGKEAGYIRYQLSWGGPSDEIRIYSGENGGIIEYWYLDWFDGASVDITEDPTAQYMANYCRAILDL